MHHHTLMIALIAGILILGYLHTRVMAHHGPEALMHTRRVANEVMGFFDRFEHGSAAYIASYINQPVAEVDKALQLLARQSQVSFRPNQYHVAQWHRTGA